MNRARRFGRNLGKWISKIMAKFYWTFPWLRKRAAEKSWSLEPEKKPIRDFIEAFYTYKNIHFISCETPGCNAIGLDYNAEQHGWKYEGGHIWSCPKCRREE